MFGHQNDQGNQDQDSNDAMDQGVHAIINNDVTPPPMAQAFMPPSLDDPATSTQNQASDSDAPTVLDDSAEAAETPPVGSDSLLQPADLDTNGLLDIKQQALTELSPLVGHLEQSPEEKFRTTMMMIQASDNQALVKDAYAAAQQITDEKSRAQALLDVINEINYFTQHAKA